MSKKLIFNISALALGLALAGCSVLPEEDFSDKGREIKFTASVGTFQTKATDTAFELGDAVGLFADSPVNASNVRMTWDGKNLVPDTKLMWGPGNEEVYFQAYYPYDPEKTQGWEEFFVNADQSTHELFTQSDFMTATSSQGAPDGTVILQFRHRFTKLIIHVDNTLSDLDIANVFVGNVRGRVNGDVWGGYGVTGLPGTIKAGKAVTPDGENVWALIIPSQDAAPQLMITTTDGKQFTYQPEWEIWFGAGYRYNIHVTMDGSSIFTDFTADVTEWTDNNDLAFPIPGHQKWSVTGTIHGMNWEKDLPMENCYDGSDVYYAMIYYKEGDEFKLRKDGSWTVNCGIQGGDGIGEHNGIQDGPNITLPSEGVYEIFFCPSSDNYIYIQYLDSKNWSLTGTFENLNWNLDHYVDYSGSLLDGDGNRFPLVYFEIKAHGGDEFKIRFDRTWFLEYGYDSDWGEVNVLQDRVLYPLRKAGPNMVLPKDGVYRILFDFCNKQVSAEWLEELPPVAPSAITIDGDFSDWDALDPSLVSVAYCVDGQDSPRPDLKLMKTYSDQDNVYVYLEYDLSRYDTIEFADLMIMLNGDNSIYTGGYRGFWDQGDYPCIDVLAEGFVCENDNWYYEFTPYSYYWSGDTNADGWSWEESSNRGFVYGIGNSSRIEIALRRDMYPLGKMADDVTIGAMICVNGWDATGSLPNGQITEENPYGYGPLLPAILGGGVVLGLPVPEPSTYYNPFNIAEAIAYFNAGGTEDVYIKGIVSKTVEFSAQYGNVTFWISDDGQYLNDPAHDFEIYRARWFGGRNWQEGDVEAKPGDEVVVYGRISKYNNFYETAQGKAYVFTLNGYDGEDSNLENPKQGEEWGW